MNRQHYESQMNRLAETFGAQSYKRERVALIWNEVKDLSEHDFTRAIDELILNNRQAPLADEFRALTGRARERAWAIQKHTKTEKAWVGNPDCSQCGDLGVFITRTDACAGPFAFRCHCTAGDRDPRKQIPQYKGLQSITMNAEN